MWNPWGWVCQCLTDQLKSRISIVSKVYVARGPAWQLQRSVWLLWSPSVPAGPGYFVEKITEAKAATGTEGGD